MMKVLVTGSDGFIGKNLVLRLRTLSFVQALCFTRMDDISTLSSLIEDSDFIVHLAGANRPKHSQGFVSDNVDLTERIVNLLKTRKAKTGTIPPIFFASSIQADRDTLYGKSKLAAEELLQKMSEDLACPVYISRLTNIFGKWCKPNYNSVVATFCHNVARDIPVTMHDANTKLKLLYIDDLIAFLVSLIQQDTHKESVDFCDIGPIYTENLGDILGRLKLFHSQRKKFEIGRVGSGLDRALYSTYISYLPSNAFSYNLIQNKDNRGVFSEFLKTEDSGQFSFFTVNPGAVRGGHYHDTKTEKFLVVKGEVRFDFLNMDSGEEVQITTSEHLFEVVDTIPGWLHSITNTGRTEAVVLLWANEVFDVLRPDTIFVNSKEGFT